MRKVKENYNSMVIRILGQKPVAFNPMLAVVANSTLAGLFLSQLLYWWGKGSNSDWIYKTIKDIKKETFMSRSEQDRAIKIWKKLGILKIRHGGIPMKRFFQIDEVELTNQLELISGQTFSLSANQHAEFGKLDFMPWQSNTESTQENTDNKSLETRADDIPF